MASVVSLSLCHICVTSTELTPLRHLNRTNRTTSHASPQVIDLSCVISLASCHLSPHLHCHSCVAYRLSRVLWAFHCVTSYQLPPSYHSHFCIASPHLHRLCVLTLASRPLRSLHCIAACTSSPLHRFPYVPSSATLPVHSFHCIASSHPSSFSPRHDLPCIAPPPPPPGVLCAPLVVGRGIISQKKYFKNSTRVTS